ncbi:MAG: hypothetical protein WBP82_12055, partial [Leuconostoc mesenteroides]
MIQHNDPAPTGKITKSSYESVFSSVLTWWSICTDSRHVSAFDFACRTRFFMRLLAFYFDSKVTTKR